MLSYAGDKARGGRVNNYSLNVIALGEFFDRFIIFLVGHLSLSLATVIIKLFNARRRLAV